MPLYSVCFTKMVTLFGVFWFKFKEEKGGNFLMLTFCKNYVLPLMSLNIDLISGYVTILRLQLVGQ